MTKWICDAVPYGECESCRKVSYLHVVFIEEIFHVCDGCLLTENSRSKVCH